MRYTDIVGMGGSTEASGSLVDDRVSGEIAIGGAQTVVVAIGGLDHGDGQAIAVGNILDSDSIDQPIPAGDLAKISTGRRARQKADR